MAELSATVEKYSALRLALAHKRSTMAIQRAGHIGCSDQNVPSITRSGLSYIKARPRPRLLYAGAASRVPNGAVLGQSAPGTVVISAKQKSGLY